MQQTNTTNESNMKPDVILSTGKTISHRLEANGSTFAFTKGFPEGGNEMSQKEYSEYVSIILNINKQSFAKKS